jgi:hypothetical protein
MSATSSSKFSPARFFGQQTLTHNTDYLWQTTNTSSFERPLHEDFRLNPRLGRTSTCHRRWAFSSVLHGRLGILTVGGPERGSFDSSFERSAARLQRETGPGDTHRSGSKDQILCRREGLGLGLHDRDTTTTWSRGALVLYNDKFPNPTPS